MNDITWLWSQNSCMIIFLLSIGSMLSSFSPTPHRSIPAHGEDEECSHCPTCVLMPVMAILSKIASHPCLLQAPRGCDVTQNKAYQFVTGALSATSLDPIGGPVQSSRICDVINHVQHSGKMKILDTLLTTFCVKMEKTLLFSYSTKTLSLIENYIKARGWRYCRLDGSTVAKSRQAMVDKFNKDCNILVFLISTKAGGVGLNLTSASKVIIFDVNWNPAQDAQAQDRAYRMGQKQHVTVYRLIAQGTMEELTYMRQKYKQVLSKAVMGGDDEGGMTRGTFEGIQGDSDARGELFGAENMLQFIDGSLLLKLRQAYDMDEGVDGEGAGSGVTGGDSGAKDVNCSSIPHKGKMRREGDDLRSKLVTLNETSALEVVAYLSNNEQELAKVTTDANKDSGITSNETAHTATIEVDENCN